MDSSDDDILCVKRKSCSAKVMDSDSDSDNDNEKKSRPQTSITAFSHFEHSDADDEVGNLLNVCGKRKQKVARKRVIRPKFLVEEESEDEEIRDIFNLKKNMDHNDVQANEDECGRGSSVSSLEKKTDDNTHNGKSSFNPLKQSDLYDAEESDEERPSYTQEGSSNDRKQISKSRFSGADKDFSVDVDNKVKRHVSNNSKKSRQKERKSKTNAIQEIHRETQRLIRESSVSLPYHKPRQRTLAEFLKRRESYPIPPVKLTSENIHLVCKTLEERIQTAEEFFRSESEEDSDNNSKDDTVNRNQTDTGTKLTTDVSPCSNNSSKTGAHSESVNEPDIHILSNGRINEKSGINITTTNSNNAAVSSNAGIPVDVNNACTSSIIDDVNKTKTDGSGSCVITKQKAFSVENNYEIKNDEDVSNISIDMNNDKMKLDTSTISIITETVNSEEGLKNGIYHVSGDLRHKEIVPPDVIDNACTGFITPQIDNHCNDNFITKETFSIDHSFNKGLQVVSNYDKSIVCDSVSNIEDVPTKTKFSLVNHFSNFSRDIDETNLHNELIVTSDNRSRLNSHTVSSITKKISMDLVNFDDNACTDAVAGVSEKHSNSHGQLTDNTSDFHLHCGDYQSVSDRIQHLQADRKDSNSVDQLTETTSNFHLHYDNFQSVSAPVDKKGSSLPYQMTENTSEFHLHYGGTQSVSNPIQAHSVDRKGSSLHDQLTENTSDFHLHYGDTQSVSDPIQPLPLNKKDNSSHDQLTENTSDFHLLYSESQSPSDPINDASQEMKRLQEKYLPKQPVSDSNKNCQQEGNEDKNEQLECEVKETIGDKLQQIIRRSLPGLGDIAKLKPKLSGAPNEMINLDDELPKKGGVINLVQRLIKHSARRHPPKKEHVELGVVSVDSEDIVHKDIMSYTLDDEIIDDNPELAKPGAKHKKLKDELQQQIFKMRAKEWAERTHERKIEDEELSDCKMDDVLDEIETILEPDIETESEEEGEEEEDVPIVEKKRTKSAFVEDEADVSDDCDRFSDESESADETNDVESDDIGGNTDNDGNASQNATLSDSLQDSVAVVAINNSNSCTDIIHKNEEFLLKSLDSQKTESSMTPLQFPKDKICITPDQTSSVSKLDSRSQAYEQTDSQNNQMYRLERSKTFDLFISQDEDYIPPYQIQSITPRMNSEESLMKRSQEASPFPMNETPSPLTARSSFHASGTSMPKKLFAYSDSTWTQNNMSELLGLCSGQFPGDLKALVNTQRDTSRADLEDELVGLCSGKFEIQPKTATQGTNLEDLCSGKFPTQCISRNNTESDQSQNESVKNSMPSQHSDLEEEDEKVATKPLKFFDSDEDSEEEKQEEKNGTRKRNRQLHFSDDELDQDDDAKSDISDASSDRTEQLVEYDSEENEIPRGRGAAEFFENEAELSENDWASADEDEQGLDDFEQEEGDDEALDHHKLKEQLGKIHMRRQLDEDRREVRLLQEMLLEDGELHSEGGRERKFRWKNVDNVDNNDFVHQDSDNEVVDEEDVENEEQWRKARHEREMFLQKQKKEESDLLLDENDSQLLLLGKAALKRMSSFEQTLKIKQNNSESSPDPKHPYKLLTKRGSFLARGDRELARIAEITAGTKDGPVLGPKNTRNFVFATLSPEKKAVEAEKVQLKKRPAASGSTPSSVKRSRFSKENSRGLRLLDLLSQS